MAAPLGPQTCYASAARTATPTTMNGILTRRAKGLIVVIDTTAAGSSPSTTFAIQTKDAVTGKWITLLVSAAITGVGTVMLQVGPGIQTATNLSAGLSLLGEWRVVPTHGNSTSHTYTVSGQPTY